MKLAYKLFFSLFFLLLVTNKGMSQNLESMQYLFPKGEKLNSKNFTGTVYVNMLIIPDSACQTSIGNVTFEPKARTNWHKHPGGQVLLITDGQGYYQEMGKPVQLIKKGDVVKIAPFVVHWHGASPDSSMTHIAVSMNIEKGSAIWLDAVTDEEYTSLIVK